VKRIARSFAVTVLAWPFCAHNAHSQASDEIVLANELRTAFYEHAPRALASAMSQAVATWCSSKHGAAESDALSWLCAGGNLVYFRSVYINGDKGPHGLVCEHYDGHAFRYLGLDLAAESVADHSCVPAASDGSRYELVVDEVGDGDA